MNEILYSMDQKVATVLADYLDVALKESIITAFLTWPSLYRPGIKVYFVNIAKYIYLCLVII